MAKELAVKDEAGKRQALQNIIGVLQKEPLYYRNFGVYWWRLKAMMKAAGFGPDQHPILGDFDEPTMHQRFAGLSDEEFLREALADQMYNARYNRNQPQQADPEGGFYHIFDEDLGQ